MNVLLIQTNQQWVCYWNKTKHWQPSNCYSKIFTIHFVCLITSAQDVVTAQIEGFCCFFFSFSLKRNKIVRFCIWSVLQTHISSTYMLTVLSWFKIIFFNARLLHSDIFNSFIQFIPKLKKRNKTIHTVYNIDIWMQYDINIRMKIIPIK